MAHLLPLTKYVVNGQYVKVQPIATNFAERCICTILTRNQVVQGMCSYSDKKLGLTWGNGTSIALWSLALRPLLRSMGSSQAELAKE